LSAQAGNSRQCAEITRRFLRAASYAWRWRKEPPGFVPKGEVRQPGADASPHGVTRQRNQSQAARPSSIAVAVFHNRPQRKTPAPKGARVYRRMGEGLGAGGHSTRRYRFNAEASIRFPIPEIIFGPGRADGGAGGARAPDAPGRWAVRRGGHPETPDIANGCEDGPARRRGPRPRSACRPETGSEDRLQGNP